MITVYTASLIRTMDDQQPTATAVAVRDGIILSVGTLESLTPWLDSDEHTVDDRYADQVLIPGLIDPHLHPMLPALLTQFPFIAPEDWDLPTGFFPGKLNAADYWSAVAQAYDAHGGDHPFVTWGYSAFFHGPMSRDLLDQQLSSTKPILIWERSFHQIYANTAGLAWLGVQTEADLPDLPGVAAQVNLAQGHFYEGGLAAVMPKVQEVFATVDRLVAGYERFAQMVRQAGITTVADMGLGIVGKAEDELALQLHTLGDPAVGFRVLAVPNEMSFIREESTPAQAMERVSAMQEQTVDQNVVVGDHFKLFADGAFFSQGFQVCSPGYIDGHHGEWVAPPKITTEFALAAWNAGHQIHIHVNGDAGADYCLDLIGTCFDQRPRLDHRFTMEHWGYATDEQNRRAKALGAQVSMQPNYVHVLGDKYQQDGLGSDRGSRLSGAGTVLKYGMPLALHSDCPMAPIDALGLARTAVQRRTLAGHVVGEGESITVEQALRAVTIDAAWILRMENQVGSIRAGKSADFTVVDRDPVADLGNTRVLGSVFKGTPVATKTATTR